MTASEFPDEVQTDDVLIAEYGMSRQLVLQWTVVSILGFVVRVAMARPAVGLERWRRSWDLWMVAVKVRPSLATSLGVDLSARPHPERMTWQAFAYTAFDPHANDIPRIAQFPSGHLALLVDSTDGV